MWEMIQNMASDRLWIYTGIVGSIFGALFISVYEGRHVLDYGYMESGTFLFRLYS